MIDPATNGHVSPPPARNTSLPDPPWRGPAPRTFIQVTTPTSTVSAMHTSTCRTPMVGSSVGMALLPLRRISGAGL